MKFNLSKEIDQKRAKVYFDKLMQKGNKIELKKFAEGRTVSQHKYLHICLTMFGQETGYTCDEAKELFTDMLPELMIYEKNGRKFRRSTSDLSKEEISVLIDKIRNESLRELGLYIPDSEEYLIHKFEIEKQYGI